MALLIAGTAFAGNKDRAGQAGASHLLINPWARSSGWGGAGAAYDKGLEGQFMNVASLAFTKQTEIVFAHTRWLEGADISINTAGIAQNLGKTRGVIGLTFSAMSFGEIPVTTVDKPEGTGATYSPRYLNIGVYYARSFSKRIHGGITARVINEAIGNISANGFTIDASVIDCLEQSTKLLHKNGFYHRDLHERNIMLSFDDEGKVNKISLIEQKGDRKWEILKIFKI